MLYIFQLQELDSAGNFNLFDKSEREPYHAKKNCSSKLVQSQEIPLFSSPEQCSQRATVLSQVLALAWATTSVKVLKT